MSAAPASSPRPSAAPPAAAPPLRWAVIGCGMLARSQHLANIVASPQMRLQVCCDVDEQSLELCREQFRPQRISRDFREVAADPEVDAIVLATTEKLRLPVIEAAAAAGKPIYVEKPLARTLAEMKEIQQIVHQSGISFCLGHNRRSSPAMLAAHQIFRDHMADPKPCPWRFDREGEGRPRLADDGVPGMSVRINDDWYSWKGWVFDKKQAPAGPMLFEMTHFTDMCNWFLAADPLEVVALEHSVFNHGVIIRYRGGAMATIMMCSNGTFGYPKELYEIFGNGGAVIVDHMLEVRTAGITDAPDRQIFPMLSDRHPDVGREGGLPGWLAKKRAAQAQAAAAGDPMLQFTAEPDKGHAHALGRFLEEIRGFGPRVCGIDESVLATRVALAAVASVRQRRIVSLEEVQ